MSTIARRHNSTSASKTGSRKRKERPKSVGSLLLSNEENLQLFDLLGRDRISLASGVAQLLCAHPENHTWRKLNVGVAILVKDYQCKNYQLCMYDLFKQEPLWSQIMYNNFYAQYYSECMHLISFEGDSCVYALSFTDLGEASKFKEALNKRMDRVQKGQREQIATGYLDDLPSQTYPVFNQRNMHQLTTNQQPNHHQNGFQHQIIGISHMGAVPYTSTNIHHLATTKTKAKNLKKKRRERITKEDIGNPTNFVHKMHVGWDASGGFEDRSDGVPMDETIRQLLLKIGKNPDKMNSEEAEFACKFYKDNVAKYQSLDESVHRALPTNQPASPPLQHFAAPSQQPIRQQPPPRPPPFNHSSYSASDFLSQHQQPVPMAHHHPPPPPPQRVVGASLGGMQSQNNCRQQRQPLAQPPPPPPPPPMPPIFIPQKEPTNHDRGAANVAAPPPPPPPPPPPQIKPTLPITTENSTVSTSSEAKDTSSADPSRANLLQQIQQGAKLRKVGPPADDRSPVPTNPPTLRDNMMDQIKQGTTLKHVDQSDVENNRRSGGLQDLGGIAGALARALEERRRNIMHSDDSSGSNDETNNDSEWEDSLK